MQIETYWDDILREYVAYDADTYNNRDDPLGYGETKQDAIGDLMDKLGGVA